MSVLVISASITKASIEANSMASMEAKPAIRMKANNTTPEL